MCSETWEDIGYGDNRGMRNPEFIDKVRIEYIKGMSIGRIYSIRKDIAEDLIRRGFARKIEEITHYQIQRDKP